jgi:hypothetical protein
MDHGGRHAYSHHRWFPALLLAVLVASAAVGAGFVDWRLRADDSSASGASPGAPSASGSETSSPSPASTSSDAPATGLGDCRALFAQELQAQLAADASMSQWQLHIDAMNQLVAGKITLAEATAYWASTRKGAIHRVERFRRLDARLARSDYQCTSGGRADPALAACVHATRAVGRALHAARTATTTWRHHIREMEMLRSGDLSPTRALNMWLAMWRDGQDQVERYGDRTMRSLHARCA